MLGLLKDIHVKLELNKDKYACLTKYLMHTRENKDQISLKAFAQKWPEKWENRFKSNLLDFIGLEIDLKFQNADLTDINFSHCTFASEVEFQNTKFNNTDLTNCDSLKSSMFENTLIENIILFDEVIENPKNKNSYIRCKIHIFKDAEVTKVKCTEGVIIKKQIEKYKLQISTLENAIKNLSKTKTILREVFKIEEIVLSETIKSKIEVPLIDVEMLSDSNSGFATDALKTEIKSQKHVIEQEVSSMILSPTNPKDRASRLLTSLAQGGYFFKITRNLDNIKKSLIVIDRIKRKEINGISDKEIANILKLPKECRVGKAVDNGGCFFDAFAQTLNAISNTAKYNEKLLRELCHQYNFKNKEKIDKWNLNDKGGFVEGDEYAYSFIQYTQTELDESFNRRLAIWGRSNIEGVILCEQLDLKLYIGELHSDFDSPNKFILNYEEITKEGVKSMGADNSQLNFYSTPCLIVSEKK